MYSKRTWNPLSWADEIYEMRDCVNEEQITHMVGETKKNGVVRQYSMQMTQNLNVYVVSV